MVSEGKKDSLSAIQQEISELEKSIEYYKEALQKTYDLLEKADERLKEEREHYDHWLKVVENLEKSLIEIRGILQGKEAYLLELRKKYNELLYSNGKRLVAQVLSDEERELLAEGDLIDIRVARELLNVSSEKLSQLTISEISQIVDGMKIKETVEINSESQQVSTPIPDSIVDVREHIRSVLTSALRKIWNNQVRELTQEERRILLSAFHSLDEKRRRTPQEDRLHRVMSAMIRLAFQNYKGR